ncbi:MAG: GNAT family N-acetyltransferase [Phototrophicaceae bacterium]
MTDIRYIHIDDLITHYAPAVRYSFYPSPPVDLSDFKNQRPLYEDTITLGVFENDKAVATAKIIPMTQNIRGVIYPMGGVAGVTSNPTTRRKGHVKALMLRLFEEMRSLNMPVSTLYPFRESFYERLGYSLFNHIKSVRFNASDMKPLLNKDFAGSVDFVNNKDAWDIGRAFIRQYQTKIHGMGLFTDKALDFLYGTDDYWLAIARDDNGTVIGTMAYKIKAFQGTFEIHRFFTENSLGRYLLLQFIAKHIDQVSDVHFKTLPAHEFPETWFSDLSTKYDPDIWLTPMGRVIDVLKLAGMKVGEGKIAIKVEDEFCPWNNGIFSFEAHNGRLSVSEADTGDCALSIQAISALIYGTHNPNDFQWRGWGNPSREQIQVLESLFPRESPYLFIRF